LIAVVLVTEKEAAEILSLCARTIYQLRKNGELPYVEIEIGGGKKRKSIRYRRESLEEWAKRKEKPSVTKPIRWATWCSEFLEGKEKTSHRELK
jgi:excisionase family DNA binding protein